MKVLVTGATGFLGSWVVRALLRAGDRARVLVRHTSKLDTLAGLELDLREGDILDRRSIEDAAKGVDAIVHVAALVSLRRRDSADLRRVNIEGTRNVLEIAAATGRRAIHTSSIGALGFSDEPSLRDETCRLSPEMGARYVYAATKLASENVALELAASGADIVVLNPGLLLGPGDLHLSSTRFVHHLLRGTAPFCPRGGTSLGDVRAVAGAYPKALRAGRAGERYILAGINRTYREIFDAVARAAGRRASWTLPTLVAHWWGFASDAAGLLFQHPFEEFNLGTVAYSTRFNYCDSTKATRAFGYAPGPFDELIRVTVADHLARSGAADTSAASAHPRTRPRPSARGGAAAASPQSATAARSRAPSRTRRAPEPATSGRRQPRRTGP
jgi:dihydroflavonol-4-reductase